VLAVNTQIFYVLNQASVCVCHAYQKKVAESFTYQNESLDA